MVTPTLHSGPPLAAADAFLGRLAAADLDGLAIAFAPDVTLNALLPGGFRSWNGPEAACRAFTRWFGGMDEYTVIETSAEPIGNRLQLRWRLRVRAERLGTGYRLVEQHGYADAGPTGRIQRLNLVCSGFCEEGTDV